MHKQDCFRGKFKLGIGERQLSDSEDESLTESDISSSDLDDDDDDCEPMVKPSIEILSDQDINNSEEEEKKAPTSNV